MPKPSTLKFRVRRTRSGARLTFTAPSELDGAQQLFDYQIDMTDAELRKLYEEAAKAVADAGVANRRAKRALENAKQQHPTIPDENYVVYDEVSPITKDNWK